MREEARKKKLEEAAIAARQERAAPKPAKKSNARAPAIIQPEINTREERQQESHVAIAFLGLNGDDLPFTSERDAAMESQVTGKRKAGVSRRGAHGGNARRRVS